MERSDYQKSYQKEYQTRTKRVGVVLSLSEHRSLSRAAKASGEALAAYVKRQALEAHNAQSVTVVPPEIIEQLAELDRVVRNIANNVNQIAHHSNRVRQVLDDTQPFLYIQKLETELKRVIASCVTSTPAPGGDKS